MSLSLNTRAQSGIVSISKDSGRSYSTSSVQRQPNVTTAKRGPLLNVPSLSAIFKRKKQSLSGNKAPLYADKSLRVVDDPQISPNSAALDSWVFDVPSTELKCLSSTDLEPSHVKGKIRKIDEYSIRGVEDIRHQAAMKRTNFKSGEWKKPCKESLVVGAPKPFIGTCPPMQHIEDIAKMSKAKQKFFLTQDPRKKYCLRNPQVLRQRRLTSKQEFNAFTKMVKHADNVLVETESISSEPYICEVKDLENPLQLDFQGMDYKLTYQKDEQELLNQHMYRRVCRHMERMRIKKEMVDMIKNEMQEERVNVPPCFDVKNRTEEMGSVTSTGYLQYGKLYRSADKPYNKLRIESEHQRRCQRYRDIYLQQKAKNEDNEKRRQEQEADNRLYKSVLLADDSFKETVNEIDEVIIRSYQRLNLPERKVIEKRTFPHSMRETMVFKQKLKEKNRIKRDEAIVKKEFYLKRVGKEKSYPEADMEISSDRVPKSRRSNDSPLDGSTDDEDDIEVGKANGLYKLRGFHFKLGDTLRGKLHQYEKSKGVRKERGCMTRDEWLSQLVPKKERVKLDVEKGLLRDKDPDDPELTLFYPEPAQKPSIEKSAVKQFIQKRLGRHYDRVLRKNLKIAQPRLRYSVKKFNLISFLFGDTEKRLNSMKGPKDEADLHNMHLNTTLEYIHAKEEIKKHQRQIAKEKRLELLGIPYQEVKKSRLETYCENSDSDSISDWMPDPEPEFDSSPEAVEAKIAMSNAVRLPQEQRGNMPAPAYREPTLRCHPRHPRQYEGLRVPSALLDHVVKDSDLPHMLKLPQDRIAFTNVHDEHRPFTKLFDGRHHHDHWVPTQNKVVDVHYQAKIVTPQITDVNPKHEKFIVDHFQVANPPCNAFVDTNLAMPKFDTTALIFQHRSKAKQQRQVVTMDRGRDKCVQHDLIVRSRPQEDFVDFDYPGHKEYLQFIHEIRESFNEHKRNDHLKDQLLVNRDALLEELENDLKSIESCLTSMSSSVCTNLTNDSGSFLLMEGKTKVPLDYIRRAIVPFEEYQRSRFRAEPIDVDAEENNPFKVLPFSGQGKAQQKLAGLKDNFFTFNTRLQNGLRLRLEVPVDDVRQHLLGIGIQKHYGLVATDIDENYVDELNNRPPVRLFKFKSRSGFVKDALRLKFESLLIQGQMVRTKIYDRLNEKHWINMQKAKILYERLFVKWEKREYEAAMSVVYEVKSFYDITDLLKGEYRKLERQRLILNMDIVFIEGNWIHRIMLQNFHYLMGDQEWRYANDWIHRLEYDDTELENYEESIKKRTIVNIRQRDKDDAWAIKEFYEDVYLPNKQPILVVFPNVWTFTNGIENLKIKTFVLLLELHFTLTVHTELQARLETFMEWCRDDLLEKEDYVQRKCAKKYFMEDRVNKLRSRAVSYMSQPLLKSFNDPVFNRSRAIIAEVWRQIVPYNQRGANEQDHLPIHMVAMLSQVVTGLIAKFELLPRQTTRVWESIIRRRTAHFAKLSKQAYLVERRIEKEMKRVRRNLEPPFQKPPREGKLPRTYIKKKRKRVRIKELPISEHTKFFFRAFHEDGDVMQLKDARESLYVIDTIQESIVPFYFDHFLKLNGYTPNYNFKTQIEVRDGAEEDRVTVRQVLPELREKLDQWEAARKKVMEENISKNPKMYENVQF